MKVLVVITSTDLRGAEVEGSQLAGELTAAGTPAEVVALAPGGVGGLDVEVLGSSPKSFATMRALRRRARGADVVVAYGSSTLPACALALLGSGVPFVYRSIGDPSQWVRGGLHRWRTGLLFRRATHVVALWPAAAEAITRLYRVPPDRITCIPNARPLPSPDEPDRATARRRLGVPEAATVVAWAGALSREKRPVLAVEAVAALDGAWLVMAGDGPLRPDVTSACDRLLPERHRLVGMLDSLDVLWAAADVALLTSSTEGMPGVLIEAALRGVPAVATDVGAVRELVLDGRFLAPEGVDGPALASVIAGTCRAGSIERSLVAGAEARFSWRSVVGEWTRVVGHIHRQVV